MNKIIKWKKKWNSLSSLEYNTRKRVGKTSKSRQAEEIPNAHPYCRKKRCLRRERRLIFFFFFFYFTLLSQPTDFCTLIQTEYFSTFRLLFTYLLFFFYLFKSIHFCTWLLLILLWTFDIVRCKHSLRIAFYLTYTYSTQRALLCHILARLYTSYISTIVYTTYIQHRSKSV